MCEKLRALRESLPDERQLAFLHRIDNVLFSHGGLANEFVRLRVPERDALLETVNGCRPDVMWQDISPIWYRPQGSEGSLYGVGRLLQVAGHTPMKRITRKGDLISCDVFSTYRNGQPIGTQEFLLLDTVTWEFEGAR